MAAPLNHASANLLARPMAHFPLYFDTTTATQPGLPPAVASGPQTAHAPFHAAPVPPGFQPQAAVSTSHAGSSSAQIRHAAWAPIGSSHEQGLMPSTITSRFLGGNLSPAELNWCQGVLQQAPAGQAEVLDRKDAKFIRTPLTHTASSVETIYAGDQRIYLRLSDASRTVTLPPYPSNVTYRLRASEYTADFAFDRPADALLADAIAARRFDTRVHPHTGFVELIYRCVVPSAPLPVRVMLEINTLPSRPVVQHAHVHGLSKGEVSRLEAAGWEPADIQRMELAMLGRVPGVQPLLLDNGHLQLSCVRNGQTLSVDLDVRSYPRPRCDLMDHTRAPTQAPETPATGPDLPYVGARLGHDLAIPEALLDPLGGQAGQWVLDVLANPPGDWTQSVSSRRVDDQALELRTCGHPQRQEGFALFVRDHALAWAHIAYQGIELTLPAASPPRIEINGFTLDIPNLPALQDSVVRYALAAPHFARRTVSQQHGGIVFALPNPKTPFTLQIQLSFDPGTGVVRDIAKSALLPHEQQGLQQATGWHPAHVANLDLAMLGELPASLAEEGAGLRLSFQSMGSDLHALFQRTAEGRLELAGAA